MLNSIRRARGNINVETYVFTDDATSREFADALIEKQRAAVPSNIIYDSLRSLSTSGIFSTA